MVLRCPSLTPAGMLSSDRLCRKVRVVPNTAAVWLSDTV